MKKIALKVVNEQVPGRPEPISLDWAEIMLSSMRDGGLEGVTIDDMRRRIAVIDKIEKAAKTEAAYLLLESEERAALLAVLKKRRFGGVFRAVIELLDAVENAPDVEVTEAAE